MGDDTARFHGYRDVDHYLDTATDLDRFDAICGTPDPVTADDDRLTRAFEEGDVDELERLGAVQDGRLTSPATRRVLRTWDAWDRASR